MRRGHARDALEHHDETQRPAERVEAGPHALQHHEQGRHALRRVIIKTRYSDGRSPEPCKELRRRPKLFMVGIVPCQVLIVGQVIEFPSFSQETLEEEEPETGAVQGKTPKREFVLDVPDGQ